MKLELNKTVEFLCVTHHECIQVYDIISSLAYVAPFSITINILSQLSHQKTLCVVKRNIMTQYLIAPVFNFNNTLNTNP